MVLGIIPARYASTRFPGKPLVLIQGVSMIQRTYQQAQKANLLDRVVVATDDSRIYDHVIGFGGEAVMTSPDHETGTERAAEVASRFSESSIIVNIQGDEPFIHPEQIDLVVQAIISRKYSIATLAKQIHNSEDLFNPNIVKVVFGLLNNAIYFSRQAIPFQRGNPENEWLKHTSYFKHIGLYAYKKEALMQIAAMPLGILEKSESLEQLRWLENGLTIGIALTSLETIGIDTPQDLEKLSR
jgi:3-deoxy-manno-octulosonate cytidylyltransferase (CMP-KDO synthetase)